jgi:hypothetical protein
MTIIQKQVYEVINMTSDELEELFFNEDYEDIGTYTFEQVNKEVPTEIAAKFWFTLFTASSSCV